MARTACWTPPWTLGVARVAAEGTAASIRTPLRCALALLCTRRALCNVRGAHRALHRAAVAAWILNVKMRNFQWQERANAINVPPVHIYMCVCERARPLVQPVCVCTCVCERTGCLTHPHMRAGSRTTLSRSGPFNLKALARSAIFSALPPRYSHAMPAADRGIAPRMKGGPARTANGPCATFPAGRGQAAGPRGASDWARAKADNAPRVRSQAVSGRSSLRAPWMDMLL